MKPENVLRILLGYAERDENIRAVLAEGSRAFGAVDGYSDFDIVYVTISSKPYFNGAILPFLTDKFGEIAVMQTPDNGDPHFVYTHLIQFQSGIRIDLTFNSAEFLSRTPLESATKVLLDKDGLFKDIAPPCDSDFWLKGPSEEEFLSKCNEFWWCCPYVAKAVARGQTLYAIEQLGGLIRKEYTAMLAYLAGAINGWDRVNTGKYHTDIKRYLPIDKAHYYDALIDSYVHACENAITAALDTLMEKYGTLAAEVADLLGYRYNHSEMSRCIQFVKDNYKMRKG